MLFSCFEKGETVMLTYHEQKRLADLMLQREYDQVSGQEAKEISDLRRRDLAYRRTIGTLHAEGFKELSLLESGSCGLPGGRKTIGWFGGGEELPRSSLAGFSA